MFKSFIILYFLCVATLSITAQTDSLQQQLDAYKNAPEYVKEGMPPLPDASRFLPAPTDENDTRFVSDSCMYECGKTFRGTLRGDTAIADAGYAIAYFLKRFSPAVNQNLTEETHPKLTQLLLSVMNAGNKSIQKAKKRFARRRPYHHFGEGTPVPQDEYPDDFTSYPSGHAVRAWMAAMALTAVSPENADAIMKIGYEIGQSRIILGFHYQSDVDAARLAASATFARLCAEKKFHKAIENAKKELK
jgi:acid phosphatase (class A)